MTIRMRGSEHNAGIGTHRSDMISGWANRQAGARKVLAAVVTCLFMLQSLVLATGSTERGKRPFEATTLIAKVLCSPDSNDQTPAERRLAHPKCCGLCSANRGDEDLRYYDEIPTTILVYSEEVQNSTVVYAFYIPHSNSATAQIVSRSPRAPPYVS